MDAGVQTSDELFFLYGWLLDTAFVLKWSWTRVVKLDSPFFRTPSLIASIANHHPFSLLLFPVCWVLFFWIVHKYSQYCFVPCLPWDAQSSDKPNDVPPAEEGTAAAPPGGLSDADLESNWDEAIETFDAMDLPEELLRGIYSYGFEKPSAIQQRAIKPTMLGRDLIAQAQSGTVRKTTQGNKPTQIDCYFCCYWIGYNFPGGKKNTVCSKLDRVRLA